MKTTLLKISFFFLFLSLTGAGCEKDERNPLCYQGKVVSLNQGSGCQNIIEIVETIKDGELESGNTISFDLGLYGGTLKVGDVVYFKINQHEDWKVSQLCIPRSSPTIAHAQRSIPCTQSSIPRTQPNISHRQPSLQHNQPDRKHRQSTAEIMAMYFL